MKTSWHICTIFHHNNRSDRDRLSGVLRYAAGRPDWEVRMIDRSSPNFERDCTHVTANWRIDGLIFTALGDYRHDLRAFLRGRKLFTAKIDALENDSNEDADVSVRIDADAFAEAPADLLFRRGFRSFGFYGTEVGTDSGYSKLAAAHFIRSARRRKVPCYVFHEPESTSLSAALLTTAKWVSGLPKPCGILAYSDDLARNLIDACRLAKVNVPEQVGVIGVDDAIDICESTRPTITSLLPDFEMGGYHAASLLDSALHRGRHTRCRTEKYGMSRLVERASTQDVRNSGRLVSIATEFIRTAPLDQLTADAVASKTHISRRLLELHFKKVVGRGVHATIQERRLTTLRDKIIKTSTPLGELALACGFKTLNTAQVAFNKRYGQSMSSFRYEQKPRPGIKGTPN